MQIETPSTLTVSIPPTSTPVSPSSPSISQCPAFNLHNKPSTSVSSSSSTIPKSSSSSSQIVCPFSGATASAPASASASASSYPQSQLQQRTLVNTQTQSQSQSHTCPFAIAIPSSRRPILHTLPDGTVIETRRRCPRWVRVLRFSAKFIAKQVVIRTAKTALVHIVKSIRNSSSSAISTTDNDNDNE